MISIRRTVHLGDRPLLGPRMRVAQSVLLLSIGASVLGACGPRGKAPNLPPPEYEDNTPPVIAIADAGAADARATD